MGRTVILETRDGWRKSIKIPEDSPYPFRHRVMAARDFGWDRAPVLDSAAQASYRYMEFELTYEFDQQTLPDGTIGAIEIWRER